MKDRYTKLQIEVIVNKLLYSKGIIEKETFEEVEKKIDKLIFEENKMRKQGEMFDIIRDETSVSKWKNHF